MAAVSLAMLSSFSDSMIEQGLSNSKPLKDSRLFLVVQ
jgi:hypothetical protein